MTAAITFACQSLSPVRPFERSPRADSTSAFHDGSVKSECVTVFGGSSAAAAGYHVAAPEARLGPSMVFEVLEDVDSPSTAAVAATPPPPKPSAPANAVVATSAVALPAPLPPVEKDGRAVAECPPVELTQDVSVDTCALDIPEARLSALADEMSVCLISAERIVLTVCIEPWMPRRSPPRSPWHISHVNLDVELMKVHASHDHDADGVRILPELAVSPVMPSLSPLPLIDDVDEFVGIVLVVVCARNAARGVVCELEDSGGCSWPSADPSTSSSLSSLHPSDRHVSRCAFSTDMIIPSPQHGHSTVSKDS